MLIKICGITRPEDARAAVDAGAGALGFVFWPKSPRFIDPYRAHAIVKELPPFVAVVGLFVNQAFEYVNGVASLVGLSVVQLHGDESVAYAAGLRRSVMKAIALGSQTDETAQWPRRFTLLLDRHDPERRGGTGRTADWARAAEIASWRRIVLAGGLTPDNVAAAVRQVRPFGVDVSSGVESSPGIKDHARINGFVNAARAANEEGPGGITPRPRVQARD